MSPSGAGNARNFFALAMAQAALKRSSRVQRLAPRNAVRLGARLTTAAGSGVWRNRLAAHGTLLFNVTVRVVLTEIRPEVVNLRSNG
jgi:hypothetical protein